MTTKTSQIPMGWNSYNCFGSSVTEEEVKENAAILAEEFLPQGYDTIVVDYCWSHPQPGACINPNQLDGFQPLLAMDSEFRLLPSPTRFPSAANGSGFKPLADHIHSLGLKFGIHIMRGFPQQALYPDFRNRSGHLASTIADPTSKCGWLNHMCGILPTLEGQTYYDSLFELYAEWEVDYIKVDDISCPYHQTEIEMVHLARERCGRPITLSLSPGACPLEKWEHVHKYADLWRISPDFWDRWEDLRRAFALCRDWATYRKVTGGPDPDMLPLGRLSRRGPIGGERETRFTIEEQRSMLSLWNLYHAPMFIGGDLRVMSPDTMSLIKHPAFEMCRNTPAPADCLYHDETLAVWQSLDKQGDRIVGIFNLSDRKIGNIGGSFPEGEAILSSQPVNLFDSSTPLTPGSSN